MRKNYQIFLSIFKMFLALTGLVNTSMMNSKMDQLLLNASTVELFITGAPAGDNNGNTQYNAIRDRRQLWLNGRIPYALSSQYSSYSRSVIASAMQEYSRQTCIQWSPRTAADRDYIYIMPDRGCYSLVGRMGNRQTLSLGNGCIQKGIIIHEMMHAVGFFHEQSRTDRDEFITILWHNILPGMQGQFEKYTTATTQTFGTAYDYSSIMHYGPSAFTRNGMPTMLPKRRASIGQRAGFSRIDTYKINTLYNCPNYNNVGSGGGTAVQPQAIVHPTVQPPTYVAQTMRPVAVVSTAAPLLPHATLPSVTVAITRRSQPQSSFGSGGVITLCRNSRSDCDQLAKQGWCTRNSGWMRENCPLTCNFCSNTSSVVSSPQTNVYRPDAISASSGGACEDLRVDCAELVRRRYCITAQSFTRTYCARSCGFCFAPPVTEAPDNEAGAAVAAAVGYLSANRNATGNASTSTQSSAAAITIDRNGVRVPLSTFWPTLKPPLNITPQSVSTASQCRNLKPFCKYWKKSGFCHGIFAHYMKKNCALSCDKNCK